MVRGTVFIADAAVRVCVYCLCGYAAVLLRGGVAARCTGSDCTGDDMLSSFEVALMVEVFSECYFGEYNSSENHQGVSDDYYCAGGANY